MVADPYNCNTTQRGKEVLFPYTMQLPDVRVEKEKEKRRNIHDAKKLLEKRF